MTNFFENAKSIIINDKEVKSITINNGTIWEKEGSTGDYLTLEYTGNSFNSGAKIKTNGDVIVNWGDGTTTTINNPTNKITHTYTDGKSTHKIRFIGEVTSLGDNCFYQCTGLTNIIIPSSITSFGDSCFTLCSNLNDVIIPETVTSLGQYCFYRCDSLINMVIPSSITNIPLQCFYNCAKLSNVIISEGVTSLDSDSIRYCLKLTSVTIPSSVTNIGNNCFLQNYALIDYQLYWEDSAIIQYNSSKMPNNTKTIFTIPQGQTANYVAKGYPSDKLVERS